MSDLLAGDAPAENAPEHAPDGAVAVVHTRRRLAPILAGGVAVIAALLVLMLALSDTGDNATSKRLLGKPAPAIVGTGFRGDAFDLEANRGRWVIVNFFSTTCIPCELEQPELVTLEQRHATANDLAIVSVTFDDQPAAVQAFFTAKGGSWPVLLNDTGKVAISYGVTAVPESYLVAPNGVVAVKVVGGITADGIDKLLASAGN